MFRLFLSLYLLISIGLVLINVSSSFLFDKLESRIQSDKFNDVHALSQLTLGYARLLQQGQLTSEALQSALNYPIELLDKSALGLMPEQVEQLAQGKAISLFSDQSHLLFYSQVNEHQLLQIGPVPLPQAEPEQLKSSLILLSYCLLALLILAWSKPLWRDLNVLIGMTQQISQTEGALTGEVPKRSVLSPLHQALTSMSSRIAELMAIQKQMIHAVSHDIRTPLARMKFSLAMLVPNNAQANISADELNQAKLSLASDIADIEALIDNLLSFGRIESEQIELDLQEVDLCSLINNLVEKLTPLSDKAIGFCTDETTPVHYFCDGHLLERAIQNLIANSQKYGNSQVKVSLQLNDSMATIAVEDDGAGIPEDKIEQALQPFNRLEQSRNKASGGFGLGLSIVARITQWHKGEVKIEQSALGGAKVILCLPREQ